MNSPGGLHQLDLGHVPAIEHDGSVGLLIQPDHLPDHSLASLWPGDHLSCRGQIDEVGHSCRLIGIDLLKINNSSRIKCLASITSRKLYLEAPYNITQGYLASIARLPIFVNGSLYGPNHTFNTPNGTLPYNCPACFGDLRFWGVG